MIRPLHESRDTLTSEIVEKAFADEGLSLLGAADLNCEKDYIRFEDWLSEGRHASMEFLNRNKDLRRNPVGLLPGALQALVFGWPYYQGDKLQAMKKGEYGVAQYARHRDYHKELRQRAERVVKVLTENFPQLHCRITIDSAPVLERSLATKTGRGFIGKNTCFIDPKKGSFFLLGEILITQLLVRQDISAPINPSERSQDGGCGTCKRCQAHCPTGALDQDYKIDSRKCIAYWTIEHRGVIPEQFWPWVKTYIFGCDICQLACPYNRHAVRENEGTIPSNYSEEQIFEIATMSQHRYEDLFGGTPITRAKRNGLRRNALIAMTVSMHPKLDKAINHIDLDGDETLEMTKEQIKNYGVNKKR